MNYHPLKFFILSTLIFLAPMASTGQTQSPTFPPQEYLQITQTPEPTPTTPPFETKQILLDVRENVAQFNFNTCATIYWLWTEKVGKDYIITTSALPRVFEKQEISNRGIHFFIKSKSSVYNCPNDEIELTVPRGPLNLFLSGVGTLKMANEIRDIFELRMHSDSDLTLKKIASERFNCSMDSSADIQIGSLIVNDVKFTIVGNGNIIVDLVAIRDLNIEVKGNGCIIIKDGRIDNVKMLHVAGGSVDLNTTIKNLDVEYYGHGDVKLNCVNNYTKKVIDGFGKFEVVNETCK